MTPQCSYKLTAAPFVKLKQRWVCSKCLAFFLHKADQEFSKPQEHRPKSKDRLPSPEIELMQQPTSNLTRSEPSQTPALPLLSSPLLRVVCDFTQLNAQVNEASTAKYKEFNRLKMLNKHFKWEDVPPARSGVPLSPSTASSASIRSSGYKYATLLPPAVLHADGYFISAEGLVDFARTDPIKYKFPLPSSFWKLNTYGDDRYIHPLTGFVVSLKNQCPFLMGRHVTAGYFVDVKHLDFYVVCWALSAGLYRVEDEATLARKRKSDELYSSTQELFETLKNDPVDEGCVRMMTKQEFLKQPKPKRAPLKLLKEGQEAGKKQKKSKQSKDAVKEKQ